MRNGFYSFALLCTFGDHASLKGPRSQVAMVTSAARRAQAGSPFTPFQRDLPIMPELAPVSTQNGVDVYEVDIQEGMAEILPGFETPIYGYEGIYPGPTIRARKGRTAIVRQSNKLSFDTNVHLHGGYVPAKHDGHPMDVIRPAPGSTTRTRTTRTPRSSGTTTTRTAARRGRSTTAWSARTCSATSASRSSSCPRASTTCRW